uniref:Ubiquitin-like domain-containing protein n=1 Tax=Macrostomum lignano TaxID=282301 RepID=A0A1I8GXN3_9PLAT
MYINVRSMDGQSMQLRDISKRTSVKELRRLIAAARPDAAVDRQRLFFRGKLLVDEHTLFEYGVQINDVIQLMLAAQQPVAGGDSENSDEARDAEPADSSEEFKHDEDCLAGSLYEPGDRVDVRDPTMGCWFEARVAAIRKRIDTDVDEVSRAPAGALADWEAAGADDGCVYQVVFEDDAELKIAVFTRNLRPRASQRVTLGQLTEGQTVLCNHNYDNPAAVGYWYDATVESVGRAEARTTVYVGPQLVPVAERRLRPQDTVYAVLRPSAAEVAADGPKAWRSNLTDVLLASSTSSNKELRPTARDWGKGFACSGRTKTCTLVPTNHFGPVPSVEVGQSWMFRLQVSEAGVHRPPVSGIAGRDAEGAYSIVLSGGYEDDVDNGDEFLYTGSGGRDLSGNRRTAAQSCDQELTRMNRALARNVAAPINELDGADAGARWREGKPVRVVRNYKAAKHSKFAPTVGNRYDGIYKVVKYWPHVGKSGFRVWRYLMRRDDPVPAPWTPEGRKRVESLGLKMELPEGYREDGQENSAPSAAPLPPPLPPPQPQRPAARRKSGGAGSAKQQQKMKPRQPQPSSSRRSRATARTRSSLRRSKPTSRWREALDSGADGIREFRSAVERIFTCVVCCDLVGLRPATTPCGHNACLDCLQRSLDAGLAACPVCRAGLAQDQLAVNHRLAKALSLVFPGLA